MKLIINPAIRTTENFWNSIKTTTINVNSDKVYALTCRATIVSVYVIRLELREKNTIKRKAKFTIINTLRKSIS